MDDIHKRLQHARQTAGFAKATDAARAFGWNENTYRSHENGERGIKPEVASRYAQALRVNLAWLLTGIGNELEGEIARLNGFIDDDRKVYSWAEGSPILDIIFSCSFPSYAQLFVVDTHSMLPRYSRGDVVGFWDHRTIVQMIEGRQSLQLEGIVEIDDENVLFGSLDVADASPTLEMIGRPSIKNIKYRRFIPAQMVARLGLYFTLAYDKRLYRPP